MSDFLLRLGFHGSKTDTSLFIRHTGRHVCYILIYVNDIIITGSDTDMVTSLRQQLSREFSIKDLGKLHFFLGIEVVPHSRGLVLTQSRYISDLLKRTGMVDCKSVKTPMATSVKLSDSGGALMSDPTTYWSVVGALQYVTLTQLDVSFLVNWVCQFMHAPMEDHWQLVKRILHYLSSTWSHRILIKRSPVHSLQAFSDADWAGDTADRKSIGGFATYLGPNLISWTSRKQRTMARSSTEAEYKALADASAELV
ncbi:uncharacterized mitochondrial protein AtMg00810-like [Telopea speciosissima]|uniref:uncharacterized mitochondrial protein AtMg00810-like n=1 Tax=Telopea speciosissima TaxID=54955 RepID=UPI001CC432EF|nr:uncharacterized mitochondrial protein AtMg00810-like [Telopea speciosissima]